MIRKLGKHHTILCTSRSYRQVIDLAKLKHANLHVVGRHGGFLKKEKLKASIQRMEHLTDLVVKFSPDLAVSFCSPEASRVAYGLGIKHVAFSDSPHANAVMRLSIPLVHKLLIPWVIPKNEFVKYGIATKDIIQYRAIDAAVIVKEKSKTSKIKIDKSKKIIVIRPEESAAAYVLGKKNVSNNIIREISKQLSKYNIVVLARYQAQVNELKKEFGKHVIVMGNVVDGKSLLAVTDVFIGSGGTMTAEAALMGVPTISYDAVPNPIEKYLVRVGLVKREKNAIRVAHLVTKILEAGLRNDRKAQRILKSMEDPFSKLLKAIAMS